MAKIVSLNLTDRNEKVYRKYFKNNKGAFSKYVNNGMNRDYTLDPLEHLIHERDRINSEIDTLTITLEKIGDQIQRQIKKMKTKEARK